MSASICSAACSSAPSLSSNAVVASLCTASHSRHSSSLISRCAMTRVRRPSVAYSPNRRESSSCLISLLRSRASITLSAPLQYSMIFPSGVLHTQLMRFRALVNLLTFKISKSSFFPCTSTVLILLVLLQKNHPIALAKLVSAPSSGLSAWYTMTLGWSSPSGTTVWLTESTRKKSRIAAASGCPSLYLLSRRMSPKLSLGSR
mmetsp:Transcript_12639/g.31043  ORF Transcript_12639/g.31043 Transcript_12639/m.31043 type:complete len:203 (-) Transcript_12639:1499-2107(-)